jgi:predicted RND superfamily exporter protein
MRKHILINGLLIGIINSLGFVAMIFTNTHMNFEYGQIMGYGLMLAAFALVYLAVKRYRDNHLGGYINFGPALFLGLMITLVASTIYVLSWLLVYYNFMPDFMERYAEATYEGLKNSKVKDLEIEEKMARIAKIADLYKHLPWVILLTYAEILPIGTLASLVSSLVLRKSQKPVT